MSFLVEVWGDYACFSRPELKVERYSYDVMTPSAARGLLEAIYWHPGMQWHIDKIYVLSKIQFAGIRRNEVKSKLSTSLAKSVMNGAKKEFYINSSDDIVQRAALVLKNVHYVIQAHFEMTENAAESDNEGKFCDIIRRRLEKGQCYHNPYLGTREFPAAFRSWEGGEPQAIDETRDLGLMLFDMDYSDQQNITPMFFRAKLEHGVLNTAESEVFK